MQNFSTIKGVAAPDLIALLFKACAEFDLSVNGRSSNRPTAIKLFEAKNFLDTSATPAFISSPERILSEF
jgi:hypothetical protein